MSDEITITIASPSGNSDTITISASLTTPELADFAIALLSIPTDSSCIHLVKDGRPIRLGKDVTLANAGIQNGDLILAAPQVAQRSQQQQPRQAARPAPSSGGLDFSSLLGSVPSSTSAAPAAAAASTTNPSFTISGLEFAQTLTQQSAVEWDGMSLDDAVSRNPNPTFLIPILLSNKHPNLIKELNYHNPSLASKLKGVSQEDAVKIWREEMIKGSMHRAFETNKTNSLEKEMEERLKKDPMDAEANQFFGDKIRKENVEAQYRQMMEEYPESMGRVLMLYIDAEVNSHSIQAFVDSGAQNTIMSSSCAERCGLLHLLDTRFEGTAVGVGTGKILGRIHLCPIKIKSHFFPCTITVMEDNQTKNMDFLFGLDMLKRHRCKIDLGSNALVFKISDDEFMETPFLHEKDLDEDKGGTKGFDVDKANLEVEMMEKRIRDGKEGDDTSKKSGGMDTS